MSDLGNKSIMAKNIRFYMEKLGKTRYDMCKALDVSYSTFSDWVNGEKYPRIDKIEKMAMYFGISKADLVEEAKHKKNKHLIAVLGSVRAGVPIEAVEDILGYEEISEEMARLGEYFALRIKGRSMLPRFSEGDIAVVRQQADVDSGDIAIVLIGNQDATIKKVVKFNGGINLVPTNPEFEVLTFTNEQIEALPVVILGKVVELRCKF
jgi:repressor LexA